MTSFAENQDDKLLTLVPDKKVSVREAFGVDIDMTVPAFSERAAAATAGCVNGAVLPLLSRADHYLGIGLPLLAAAALVGLGLVVGALVRQGRRANVVVLLVPWAAALPYIYSGAGLSRYGIAGFWLSLLTLSVVIQAARQRAAAAT